MLLILRVAWGLPAHKFRGAEELSSLSFVLGVHPLASSSH